MELTLRRGESRWLLDVHPESHLGKLISASDRPYEWAMLEHIAAQGPTGTAVDVGAHIGNHALFFSVVCDLDVVCFEPIFGDHLEANIERNDLADAIRVERFALGKSRHRAVEDGGRVISEPGSTARAEGMLRRDDDGPIEVRPLDDFGLDDVGLVKIDVEGMEPDVLAGGEETIRKSHPLLYVEAPSNRHHQRIEKVIGPWGYECSARFTNLTPREEWRFAG